MKVTEFKTVTAAIATRAAGLQTAIDRLTTYLDTLNTRGGKGGLDKEHIHSFDGNENALLASDIRLLLAAVAGGAHNAARANAVAPTAAACDVLAERQRQVTVEGWTAQHDDRYQHGEIEAAASAYAEYAADDAKCTNGKNPSFIHPPIIWPWAFMWWKPVNPRTALVKAGALILAAIEKIDRAASAKAGEL